MIAQKEIQRLKRASPDLDALASEYQRDYGNARSYFDTSDFVNERFVEGIGCVLSLGLPKKIFDLPPCKISVLGDDIADSSLIT